MKFLLAVEVEYDKETVPPDMKEQLERNLLQAIKEELLTDSNLEAEIKNYLYKVVPND